METTTFGAATKGEWVECLVTQYAADNAWCGKYIKLKSTTALSCALY